MSIQKKMPGSVSIVVFMALALNFVFWLGFHDVRAKWPGVPPVPSEKNAIAMTLGDPEFSYRFGALTLQNLGDTGGRTTPLEAYDYQKLGAWFHLLYRLDSISNHVPMMAAYYFGATATPEKSRVIVEYLAKAGNNPSGEKWRWLAHAVYLARYRVKDLELALDLAYTLSRLQTKDDVMPMWARHMPAFVYKARGEKEAAREIIENILRTDRYLSGNEANFMKSYLVEQLDVPPEDLP